MKKTLSFSLKLTSLITFPAAAGLLILNRPIIQVLFERGVFDAWSTGLTAACLLYFSLSLPFISGVKILAPAFFSLKDTKTPVVVASLVMVVYIVSAFVLMRPLKVGGIAMALSVSQLVNFLELFRRLERKIGPLDRRNLMRSVCTSFFGAVAMGAALWIFISRFDFGRMGLAMQATVLFSAILLGIAFYAFMIFLVDPRALRSFQSLLPRKDFWKNKRG
jgi:putative peptidoglycan lipid II flippase